MPNARRSSRVTANAGGTSKPEGRVGNVREDGFFTSPEDSRREWRGGGARCLTKETGAAARRLPRRRKEARAEGKGGDNRGVEVVVTVSGLEVATRLISNLAVFPVPFSFIFRSFTVLPSFMSHSF